MWASTEQNIFNFFCHHDMKFLHICYFSKKELPQREFGFKYVFSYHVNWCNYFGSQIFKLLISGWFAMHFLDSISFHHLHIFIRFNVLIFQIGRLVFIPAIRISVIATEQVIRAPGQRKFLHSCADIYTKIQNFRRA